MHGDRPVAAVKLGPSPHAAVSNSATIGLSPLLSPARPLPATTNVSGDRYRQHPFGDEGGASRDNVAATSYRGPERPVSSRRPAFAPSTTRWMNGPPDIDADDSGLLSELAMLRSEYLASGMLVLTCLLAVNKGHDDVADTGIRRI